MYYAAFFRKWLMGLEMHANMNATAPYICYCKRAGHVSRM